MKELAGIHRGALSFEQGFTRIPNRWLRDNRLGFRAKGLLAYLLSHEVGYVITLGQIERETSDGRHAIRSAIDELESAGYLITKRTHDERGWNAGLAWFLQAPSPECENPKLENPTLENRPAYREENYIEKKTKREEYAQGDLEPQFNLFWSFYPRKVGKAAAKKAYAKALKAVGSKVIFDGVERLAADPNLPSKDFIPHPATWLNEGRWEDEPYPERTLTAEERRAKAEADAKAQREVERQLRLAREAQQRIDDEALKRERESNPVERCVHERVKVLCPKCSPFLGNRAE